MLISFRKLKINLYDQLRNIEDDLLIIRPKHKKKRICFIVYANNINTWLFLIWHFDGKTPCPLPDFVNEFLFKQVLKWNNIFVVLDALRLHVKYKTHTDKEIDEPLGIWLSPAPYRLLALSNKNNS